MNTTVINIRDFRNNIKTFADKARKKNIVYLITKHNKPILEVKPCINETIEMDDTQISYYKQTETSLEFWNNEADDNIFKE